MLHNRVHVQQGTMSFDDAIVPLTGIPPHVQLMSQFFNIQQSLATIVAAIHDCSRETIQSVINAIEDRAMIAGSVTPDRIESLIHSSIESALNANGFQDLLQQHHLPAVVENQLLTINGILIFIQVLFIIGNESLVVCQRILHSHLVR